MKIQSIALNYGHTLSGTPGCGAVGFLNESIENRRLGKRVKELLEQNNIKVYDATIDNASSSSSYLQQAVKKANSQNIDIAVSIHFNCSSSSSGNGTETLVYSTTSKSNEVANRVNNKLVKVGFRNRGVKVYPNLYWLKHTKAPSILIETCFVSNKSDADLYNKKFEEVAKAIVEGLLGKEITINGDSNTTSNNTNNKNIYRIIKNGTHIGSYSVIDNILNQVKKLTNEGTKEIRIEKV